MTSNPSYLRYCRRRRKLAATCSAQSRRPVLADKAAAWRPRSRWCRRERRPTWSRRRPGVGCRRRAACLPGRSAWPAARPESGWRIRRCRQFAMTSRRRGQRRRVTPPNILRTDINKHTIYPFIRLISWNLTIRCLAVTGGAMCWWVRQISQPSWLLGALRYSYTYLYLFAYLVSRRHTPVCIVCILSTSSWFVL